MLHIRYRIGSPRQPLAAKQRRNCWAMPPSHDREHIDQLDQADQPPFARFSNSFSAWSGCDNQAWPPNVLLLLLLLLCVTIFFGLIKLNCCLCALWCRWCWCWCWCWCSFLCSSCVEPVAKMLNKMLCEKSDE